MENGPLTKALFWLGGLTGVAFIVIGIAGGIWPGHWDDAPASDQILWVALGVGGGLALLAGLRLLPRSPWTGTALASLERLSAPCRSSGQFSRCSSRSPSIAPSVVYASRSRWSETYGRRTRAERRAQRLRAAGASNELVRCAQPVIRSSRAGLGSRSARAISGR